MGDGAFERVEIEDHKSLGTQGVTGDDSELVREYLIIAFWRYDSQRDDINILREYVIDSPIILKDSVRPLRISEQAQVAYWFERCANEGEFNYCEVSLVNDGEPEKKTIRLNPDLQKQLTEANLTFTFSLARINTKEGEPILVYSKPKLDGRGKKRVSIIQTQKEAK